MLTIESVKAIAEELIPQLAPDEPHMITVTQQSRTGQHRMINIWLDSLVERDDHRFAYRSTSVDVADTEEMVRYRIRSMLANDSHLHYAGRYEVCVLTVANHPKEPPPYEVLPTWEVSDDRG